MEPIVFTFSLQAGGLFLPTSLHLPMTLLSQEARESPSINGGGKYGCYCKGRERRNSEDFDDLCQLFPESRVPLLFIGGKDYLPLFCQLTRPLDWPEDCLLQFDRTSMH